MTSITSSPRALSDSKERNPPRQLGSLERFRLGVSARVTRWTRWEFWPTWVVYALLLPHFARLAIRHRSLTVFTAANPAIPFGGLVGESKCDILSRLPEPAIIPTALIEPGRACERADKLEAVIQSRGWAFPLILKPDVGERGSGVRLVRDRRSALAYFTAHPGPVLAQVYHPGPFEAGIFYVRLPSEPRGCIFSITDKHPPRVVGDGRSSLEALIWRHPRLRVQARVFLDRLAGAASNTPRAGESVALAIAGNHCQGTMFRDGQHLATPALAHAIDNIAASAPGFFFGRFDVRYESVQEFQAGRGFSIIELNGVLSESTNIYDPSFSLAQGLGVLARQWSLAFRIGSENVARGSRHASSREVFREVVKYLKQARDPRSD